MSAGCSTPRASKTFISPSGQAAATAGPLLSPCSSIGGERAGGVEQDNASAGGNSPQINVEHVLCCEHSLISKFLLKVPGAVPPQDEAHQPPCLGCGTASSCSNTPLVIAEVLLPTHGLNDPSVSKHILEASLSDAEQVLSQIEAETEHELAILFCDSSMLCQENVREK